MSGGSHINPARSTMNRDRRNFLAFLGEAICFGMSMTFAGMTTILPAFIGQLTSSKIVVGLFTSAVYGAWLLPQLVFANLLTNKRRKKPYMTLGGLLGRPLILFYALALVLGLYRKPMLALALLFVARVGFMATDALSAVAWFDVLAKAIPERRRGRLFGTAQAINGILSIGAGAVIAALLGSKGPRFPLNYAAIFAISGGFLSLSLVFWSFVVEPEEPVAEERPSWREYVPQLLQTLRSDRAYGQVIVLRLLAAFDLLALGFYILFATSWLNLPPATIGVYAAVQTVGGILGSLGFGAISERGGSHRVIQVATALNLAVPLIGLLLFLGGARSGVAIPVIYGLVFLLVGAVSSSFILGFDNYVLELAPAGQCPTYIGLFNTIGGVLILLPTLGGWLLQKTSYGVLFGLTAGSLAVAHALSWRLPAKRRSEIYSPPPCRPISDPL